MKKIFKVFLYVIAIFTIIGIIALIINPNAANKRMQNNAAESSPNNTNDRFDEYRANQPTWSKLVPTAVSLQTPLIVEGCRYSLKKYYFSEIIYAKNELARKRAGDGNAYIIVELELENTGDSPINLDNNGALLIHADGKDYKFLSEKILDDDYMFVGTINPGVVVKKRVAFKVPISIDGYKYYYPRPDVDPACFVLMVDETTEQR